MNFLKEFEEKLLELILLTEKINFQLKNIDDLLDKILEDNDAD